MRVRLIQDSNANPPAASLFPDNWPIRTRVRVTPRRRGAHCKLTFHSFSLETRSRVVLLASYSCTSPTIYLEIRGSSASQALITILGGRLSLFLLLPIYFFSPFYLPRTIFIPLFPPYPLRTCWLLRRFLSTSSSLWLFAFVPVSAVGVVCLCLFTCGERNGKGHVCVRVRVLGVWHVRASSANVELFLPFATYPLPASSHATLFPPSFVPAFERRLLAREPDDGVDADTGRQNARRPFRHSTRFTDRYYRSSLVSERVHQPHPRQYPPLHHRSTLAPLMEHRDRRLNLLSCRFSDLRTIRVRDEYQFFPRLPFVSHPDGCPLVRVNVQNRQNDAYFIRIKGSMTLRSFRVIHSVSLPLSLSFSLSLFFFHPIFFLPWLRSIFLPHVLSNIESYPRFQS